MTLYKYVKCRRCGEDFLMERRWGVRRVCEKCKQATCKHVFETLTEASTLKVVQCRKCHYTKTVMKGDGLKTKKV